MIYVKVIKKKKIFILNLLNIFFMSVKFSVKESIYLYMFTYLHELHNITVKPCSTLNK